MSYFSKMYLLDNSQGWIYMSEWKTYKNRGSEGKVWNTDNYDQIKQRTRGLVENKTTTSTMNFT